jgi:hypothetical protein
MELNILLQYKSITPSDATDGSNLTPEEFQKLREYPLCPSRSDKKRMIVNQLYEPNQDLEKLELPILSWPIEVVSPSGNLTIDMACVHNRSAIPLRPRIKSIPISTNTDPNRF